MHRFFYIIFIGGVLSACSKKDVSRGPQALMPVAPANFPDWPATPDNPLTMEGVELGRKLFYDKRLSGLNNISCASCHRQDIAFTDGVALNSIGASGKILHRHAPALFNLAWANKGLFWDGGATNLESQAFAPITTPDEMHQNLFELADELRADPDYVFRFRQVFDDDEIKTGNIVKALAQFQRMLVSADSRYDKFSRKERGGYLTPEEEKGRLLVESKCTSCHQGALFTDNGYHNNGLDDDFSDDAFERIFMGRYRVTNNPADLGKYRTPSLRNLQWTAPYMHDGRFASLQQVLEHYSTGVKASPSLDPRLIAADGQPGLQLSTTDKQAILAFLKTLNDSSFISNKNFSQPK